MTINKKDDKAPVTPAKPVVKEQLTDDVQKRLFGANCNHVCIYDNEKQKLLTKVYNNVNVSWDSRKRDTADSKRLKIYFESEFPKFELVAQATMQVSDSKTWQHKWLSGAISYCEDGSCTVANLVLRNKETGKLELLKAGAWFYVGMYYNPRYAAQDIALGLPGYAVLNPDFRVALLSPMTPAGKKEHLTDDVQKRLFGANYNHVCIYDNEMQTLLARYFNGAYISWDDDDTANSKKLKGLFEKVFPKFELVAQATMQVSYAHYPDNPGPWSNGPGMFYMDGEYVVGNLVIRNKETGRLELLKAHTWFAVDGPMRPCDVAREVACLLPSNGARNLKFRAALFAGRRQR